MDRWNIQQCGYRSWSWLGCHIIPQILHVFVQLKSEIRILKLIGISRYVWNPTCLVDVKCGMKCGIHIMKLLRISYYFWNPLFFRIGEIWIPDPEIDWDITLCLKSFFRSCEMRNSGHGIGFGITCFVKSCMFRICWIRIPYHENDLNITWY